MSSRVVLLLVGAFLSIAPVRSAHGSVCYDCLCRVRELGFYVDGLPDSYDCTLPGPVPPPIVVLDASSSYSGDDAINAQTGATWTMTHNLDGPSPCARNQHLGVDVFDLEDPYCGLESTERLDYCGSSFGWTTADWIDIRDDVSTYGTRTFHATTNGVLVITRESENAALGSVDSSWEFIPNYSFHPDPGWNLVVAVGQDTDCVAGGGTTSFYVGTPTSHPVLVGTIGKSVGSGVQTHSFGNWGPGKLAESRVWDQALTFKEIETMWRDTSLKFQ